MPKEKPNYTAKDAEAAANIDIDIVNGITNATSTKTKTTTKTKSEIPQNRFTARFNDEEWAFIQEKHWTQRINITDILREYVREDMKKHPELVKGIDELNK